MGYKLSSTLYGTSLPIFLLELLLSNTPGNVPYSVVSACSVSLVPMPMKNPSQLLAVLTRASSYLKKHLKSSSRSLADMLPQVSAAVAVSPTCRFPSAERLKLSSQRRGRFPSTTLCIAAVCLLLCSYSSSSGWGGRSNPLTAAINCV